MLTIITGLFLQNPSHSTQHTTLRPTTTLKHQTLIHTLHQLLILT